MQTREKDRRQERAARRALARSALYQLLSQALVYPNQEAVAALQGVDLPQAQQAVAHLSPQVATLLTSLYGHLEATSAAELQAEHGRVFSHSLSPDCPPCETLYISRHIFQQTQQLSDIGGFFRAFGLEISEKEPLDHISVELEFMHFLTYKEAYALLHHGPAKARFCREVQRKFMQDHLGRWALQFARKLGEKAGGGYYGCVASLTEAFLTAELRFLRVRHEAAPLSPRWQGPSPDDFSCPISQGCL